MTEMNGKLLIVDDLAANRDVLSRRFQRRGFDVVEVDSGQRALEVIAEQNIDLVLLDVMMPDLDGFAVLRQIRLQHSPVTLPVIMVTARTDSSDIVNAFALGANDYVTKPVDFFVALARVENQVGRKRAEEAAREAAEALRRANEGLEQRVATRTAELVAINEQLTHEIAQRQRSEAKAEYLARHDVLTGLGNRLLLRERLDQLWPEPTDLMSWWRFFVSICHISRVSMNRSVTPSATNCCELSRLDCGSAFAKPT